MHFAQFDQSTLLYSHNPKIEIHAGTIQNLKDLLTKRDVHNLIKQTDINKLITLAIWINRRSAQYVRETLFVMYFSANHICAFPMRASAAQKKPNVKPNAWSVHSKTSHVRQCTQTH